MAVLGAMVAGAVRVPLAVGAALVSVFAVFHGYAHGVEMPAASSAWAGAAGFAITIARMHLLGLGQGLGLGMTRRQRPVLARLGGPAIGRHRRVHDGWPVSIHSRTQCWRGA
jgi:urease accessory protein